MSAPLSLVATTARFEPPSSATRRERSLQLQEAWFAAGRAVDNYIGVQTVFRNDPSTVGQLRRVEWDAVGRLVRYWESYAARLQRQLRDLLASGAGNDEGRQRALLALDGTAGPSRDGALLTRGEGELLALYRAVDPDVRCAIRTLLRNSAPVQTTARPHQEPGGVL